MIYNELKQRGTHDFPFELYCVSDGHPKYEMAFHWHTELELVRVLEGTLNLTLDNRHYTLGAGDVAFVNSEVVHGATPHECKYECVVFNLSFMKTGNNICDGFIENLLSHSAFLTECPKNEEVVSLFNRFFDALHEKTNGAAFRVIGVMNELLGAVMDTASYSKRTYSGNVKDEKKVVKLKTVLKYIRENFDKSISLEDMASVAGLSCKYFCKFFKDMTGTTAVNYLTTYRSERAARKLISTDMAVTQIAYACGFNG